MNVRGPLARLSADRGAAEAMHVPLFSAKAPARLAPLLSVRWRFAFGLQQLSPRSRDIALPKITKAHRSVIAAYLASLFGVIALAAIAYWLSQKQTNAAEWVARTERVLAQLEAVQRNLLDAESTGRAFIITAQPDLLPRFSSTLHAASAGLDEFMQLVGHGESRWTRVNELRGYMDERFPHLSDTMWLRQERGFEAAVAIARTGVGRAGMQTIQNTLESMKAHERALLEQRIARQQKIVRYGEILLVCMVGAGLAILTLLARLNVREISARLAAEARAAEQARRDPLTGLPNRMSLYERLESAIPAATRHGYGLALLYLDLDGFKRVNDTLGHAAGDELLKEVARRLSSILRAEDSVARLGGDEFVVALPIVPNRQSVACVANKIIHSIGQPFTIGSDAVHVGASVGIALLREHGATAEELLSRADAALYTAKASGKATFRFSDEPRQHLAVEISPAGAQQKTRPRMAGVFST